jgi:predicted naringenin-chalcone synthase
MDHLIFHPGGKIVQTVEALFSDLGKNIDDTKRFYVCTEICRVQPYCMFWNDLWTIDLKRRKGLMLSFGPGFSAQRVLLQF